MPRARPQTATDLTEVGLYEAATILGRTPTTLKAWFGKGCPVMQRGGGKGLKWRICPADVIAWRESIVAQNALGDTKTLDIEEARRRKTAAEAGLVELELAKQKREVIELDEIAQAIAEDYANCRAKLLALPTKLAPQLSGVEEVAAMEAIIAMAIHEALEELVSDGAYSAEPFTDDDEEPEASAPKAAA